MGICLRVLKENNKRRFDSYSVRNSALIISHITFRYCRVHIFPTTFLEIAVYFWLGKDVAGGGEGEEFFTQSQSVEMQNLCSAKGGGRGQLATG